MLKYILLGALHYQALTGYQLKQFVDQTASHFWYAQTSQIYRTLDALDKDGLLTSTIEEDGGPKGKRIYQITEAGKAAFREWLHAPMTEIVRTKDELIVRLFFSAMLDKESILTQLRLQRSLHQQQLKLFQHDIPQQIAQNVQQFPERQRDGVLWDVTRRQGELLEEAYIRWLDEAIQRIEDELDS